MRITIDIPDVVSPWWTPPYAPMGCQHFFPLGLYVPPGQTVNVPCPHCGALVPIYGMGAIA